MLKKIIKSIKGIMKIPLVITLLLLASSVGAVLYNESGVIFEGSPEIGWILIMPEFDYFAKWLGEDLGAMWVYTDHTSNCLIIRKGEPTNCTLQEFSIMSYYYPAERIKELKEL